MSRLHRMITKALEATALSWEVERGKKHDKLYIEGQMVMVFSRSPTTNRDIGKLNSLIRRAQESKLSHG